MRAEIQQAVGLLKGEAENATVTKNPIASKLLVVADNLQHVEKDGFFVKQVSLKVWLDAPTEENKASLCQTDP